MPPLERMRFCLVSVLVSIKFLLCWIQYFCSVGYSYKSNIYSGRYFFFSECKIVVLKEYEIFVLRGIIFASGRYEIRVLIGIKASSGEYKILFCGI